MSGPRTYEYDVTWDNIEAPVAQSKEELRQQQQSKQDQDMEMQNLRWQANELSQLLVTILAKLDESTDRRVPSSDSIDHLRSYIELTRDQIKSARERLRKQRDLAAAYKRRRSDESLVGTTQSAAEALANYDAENSDLTEVEHDCQNTVDDARTQVFKNVYEMINSFQARFSVPLSSELEKSMGALKRSKDSTVCSMFENQIKDQLARLEKQVQIEQLESETLLEKLPNGSLPEPLEDQVFELRQKLIAVVSGRGRLNDTDRKQTETLLAEIGQMKAARASTVVENTLKDLGYETEPISETLFTEGGAIYFRKSGVDEPYYVRMVINPDQSSCNYNVVREGEQPSDNADIQMERSWCDSIPQLQNTLQARGVSLKLKRHLDSGTVPVQEINRGDLNQNFWDSKSKASSQDYKHKKTIPKSRSESS